MTPTLRTPGRLRRTWITGDPEPDGAVDVLVEVQPGPRTSLYLARFHHGWLWVRHHDHLAGAVTTPMTWAWALSADLGVPAKVRRLTPQERNRWHHAG